LKTALVFVWRQTRALLFKNCLVKCRTKKSSVQEVLFPLFFLFWLILMSMMHPHKKYGEVPNTDLGTLDTSLLVNLIVGYTPPTTMTREIMKKVAFDNFEDGIITEEYLSEEELQEASAFKPSNFVGVVFNDAMSYQLRFPDSVTMSSLYMESRASCSSLVKGCESVTYWHSGFTALQACIDAAIIQLKTNRSVWEQLELTRAVVMGEAEVMEIDSFPRAIILIYLVIAFSPFGYYLASHIVAEKERKLKEFMKILGLHDTAFWYVSIWYNLIILEKM
uniref:ABC-2 type transporter transmembrane domain-containing protein n=1 Tax=Nothoprocta perdicaria TaxID=30464 RepID=A0A8C6Z9S6_NOTPE